MFDLLEKPLVWIPVKWPGLAAGDNEGLARVVEHEIEVNVEILDRDEFKRIFQPDDASKIVTDEEAFGRIVSGWRRIVANKKPVPFTPANVVLLLQRPSFPQAFARAYALAWTNQVETREGNSESSPAAGPADEPQPETPKAAKKPVSRRSKGNAPTSA